MLRSRVPVEGSTASPDGSLVVQLTFGGFLYYVMYGAWQRFPDGGLRYEASDNWAHIAVDHRMGC